MRIELGRKGDYAVRAVLSVARHHGEGRRKARLIAAEMDLPPRYLRQILAEFVRSGVLLATAGPDGGYTLARPPEEVTLLEVIEQAEGPLRTDVCVLQGGPCDWGEVCPVHYVWSSAEQSLRHELDGVTLAQLAALDAEIESGQNVPVEPHRVNSPRRGTRDQGSTPPQGSRRRPRGKDTNP